MGTIDEMVVPGPLAWSQPVPPAARRRWRWVAVAVVTATVLAAAIVVEVPYYAIAPGTARQVNDLIAVPAELANPPEGRVLLATVALRRVSILEALLGWLDDDTAVVPEDEVLGDQNRREFRRENREQIADSKQVAVLVALRRLGFPVQERGQGGLVVEVTPASPATGHLVAGEVITAVDGQPTSLKQEVVDAVRARRPGEQVRLGVTSVDGAGREEVVTLASPPPAAAAGGGFLGVALRTKAQVFDLPFEVTIDSGTIGGPSAGLAFTLGLLDALTRGELTGGATVAVTGTIAPDGTVGDVGGVAQKTAAVRAAGADYFLVPPGELEQARARAGKRLQVRAVASVDEAIETLAALGGEPIPAAAPPMAAA